MSKVLFRSACGTSAWPLLSGVALFAVGLGVFFVSVPATAGATQSLPTPLATSIQSDAGTWATLPMGHLHQPLNTFWQLFFRPTGASVWSNQVGATATATNGGLVLASAPGQPFTAAVRPAHLLQFSPLISTANGGHSWTEGLLPKGLASSPSSLSTAPGGQTIALVSPGLDGYVLTSTTDNLSTWHTLTTARRLASGSAGMKCGLQSLSAVASLGDAPAIGADCTHVGMVGIFVERGGSWSLNSPSLSGGLLHRRIQVLSMTTTTSGLTALLGIPEASGTALVAAWNTNGEWTVSSTLTLAASEHVVSFGPAGGGGLFLLSATTSGARQLAVVDGAGAPWSQLPAPPPDTATVAFDPVSNSPIDALAEKADTLTVWSLRPGANAWSQGQVLHVKIKFGSSS